MNLKTWDGDDVNVWFQLNMTFSNSEKDDTSTTSSPLEYIVNRVCVLTLPWYPKRKEKIISHLTQECDYSRDKIFTFDGVCRENMSSLNNASQKELSVMDMMTLNQDLVDETAKNIFDNHIAMIRTMYTTYPDEPWIMFLEDDARFERKHLTTPQLRHIRRFLYHNTVTICDADVLLLGCLPFWYRSPCMVSSWVSPYIFRHHSMTLTAHGYIMSREGMRKLLYFVDHMFDHETQHVHFDMIFYLARLNVYSTFPMICYQYKAPALYKRFQSMCPVFEYISFRTVCVLFFYVSVIFPFLCFMVLGFVIVVLSRHTYQRMFSVTAGNGQARLPKRHNGVSGLSSAR